jgi:hypothetical protein
MIYKDIQIDQGADYIDTILMISTTGTVVAVNNYIFNSQLRTSYVTANATDIINVFVSDAMNGVVTIYYPAANSANISAGKYVYDIVMKDTANITTRIMSGIATVTPQATWIANISPPLPYE